MFNPRPKPEKKEKKKPKPPPKKSPKRKKEEPIWIKRREEHKRKYPNCQIGIHGICKGMANQVNHSKGRTGKNYTDENTFESSCQPCHDYVTTHSGPAITAGYAKSRLHKEL
jgi:hypothetical protein